MYAVSLLRPGDIGLPTWTNLAINCGVHFQIGRWIARRAGGDAITACFLYFTVDLGGWILENVRSQRTTGFQEGVTLPTWLFSRPSDWLAILFLFACVFAGAIWARQRKSVAARVI
jgi:hypothetical protein